MGVEMSDLCSRCGVNPSMSGSTDDICRSCSQDDSEHEWIDDELHMTTWGKEFSLIRAERDKAMKGWDECLHRERVALARAIAAEAERDSAIEQASELDIALGEAIQHRANVTDQIEVMSADLLAAESRVTELARLLLDIEGSFLGYWTDMPQSAVMEFTVKIRAALSDLEDATS